MRSRAATPRVRLLHGTAFLLGFALLRSDLLSASAPAQQRFGLTPPSPPAHHPCPISAGTGAVTFLCSGLARGTLSKFDFAAASLNAGERAMAAPLAVCVPVQPLLACLVSLAQPPNLLITRLPPLTTHSAGRLALLDGSAVARPHTHTHQSPPPAAPPYMMPCMGRGRVCARVGPPAAQLLG